MQEDEMYFLGMGAPIFTWICKLPESSLLLQSYLQFWQSSMSNHPHDGCSQGFILGLVGKGGMRTKQEEEQIAPEWLDLERGCHLRRKAMPTKVSVITIYLQVRNHFHFTVNKKKFLEGDIHFVTSVAVQL